jgi:hypothetical protein
MSTMNTAQRMRAVTVPVIAPSFVSPTVEELALQVSELKGEIVALREIVARIQEAPKRIRVRRRNVDPRKVYIAAFKARHNVTGRPIAIALDNADREELRPLETWTRATGLRLWRELWNSEMPRVRSAVRKYIYTVAPFRVGKKHTA